MGRLNTEVVLVFALVHVCSTRPVLERSLPHISLYQSPLLENPWLPRRLAKYRGSLATGQRLHSFRGRRDSLSGVDPNQTVASSQEEPELLHAGRGVDRLSGSVLLRHHTEHRGQQNSQHLRLSPAIYRPSDGHELHIPGCDGAAVLRAHAYPVHRVEARSVLRTP